MGIRVNENTRENDADLTAFLTAYAPLTGRALRETVQAFRRTTVKKNAYLLKQGGICRDVVFVRSGCLRLFYLQEDVEISVWFAFPGSSAIEIQSFISGDPSRYHLQAIDESEILSLPKTELERLYTVHPQLQEVMRKYWEDVILTLLNRFTALQTDTAEQRYLDLLTSPSLLKTIPQKYLASFLGITPTSLSRIRRQLAQKRRKLP